MKRVATTEVRRGAGAGDGGAATRLGQQWRSAVAAMEEHDGGDGGARWRRGRGCGVVGAAARGVTKREGE